MAKRFHEHTVWTISSSIDSDIFITFHGHKIVCGIKTVDRKIKLCEPVRCWLKATYRKKPSKAFVSFTLLLKFTFNWNFPMKLKRNSKQSELLFVKILDRNINTFFPLFWRLQVVVYRIITVCDDVGGDSPSRMVKLKKISHIFTIWYCIV